MIRIGFDIDGDVQYARAFDVLESDARDLSDPLGRIGERIRSTIGRQFQTEGAYGGAPWKPLNPEYAAWKESRVGPNPMLVFTGKMRGAMLSERAFTVTPRKLVYEPQIPPVEGDPHGERAAWHQRGSGDNPQRKMVELPLHVRRSMDREFVEWIAFERRKLGL